MSKDYNKEKRQAMQTCRGLANDGSSCRYAVESGKKCCAKSHSDMENYTEDEFANQRKCTKCPRPRWRYLKSRNMCDECYKKYAGTLCSALQNNNSGEFCLLTKDGDKKYCNRNHGHLNTYTEDQMNNLKKCPSCKRMVCAEDIPGEYKTCESRCRFNAEKMREKERNKEHKICKKEGCPCKAQDDNDYCGKHRVDAAREKAAAIGMKICQDGNHVCQTLLPLSYDKKACEECLAEARAAEKEDREKLKNTIRANMVNGIYECAICGMPQPQAEFILKNGVQSVNCATCRGGQADYDRNRERKNTQTNELRLNEIMRSARKREIHFDIPHNVALIKLVEPCHYCGYYETQTNRDGVVYSVMSFDRFDNTKHYTINNIVTCCHTCNIMKRAHKADDFIQYCQNIYDNFGSENEWTVPRRAVTHGQHRSDCRKHKRKTELTEEDITRIVSKRCYYCDSTNDMEQIGIDRVNPNIGYIKSNKLVACCKICNVMKLDLTIDAFYNHILEVLLHNESLTDEEYASKLKKPKKQTKLEYVSEQLTKIFEYDGKDNKYRMDLHKFKRPSRDYIEQIWKGSNITHFEPELEFCETDEQTDIWMFYRFAISSHYPSDVNGLDTKILIRDAFTKKYVGITSLRATRPHWASNTPYRDICKNANVYNISTCVAIPPFSFNFCGGKLLTMLMFSNEVKNYMAKKNIILGGLMTYSLHGDSVQYAGLDNFKLCGYTKGIGIDNTKVPNKVYQEMKKIMQHRKFWLSTSRTSNIQKFCAEYGILDATHHGIKRGIYFGTFGGNSLEFLCGKADKLEPDVQSVQTISETWYANHVIPRIKDLVERNKIMVSYDYDTYYVDKSGYERAKKARAAALKVTDEQRDAKENTERQIINAWLTHSHEMDLTKIARMLVEEGMNVDVDVNVNAKKIKTVVFRKNDAGAPKKEAMSERQKYAVKSRRSKLIVKRNEMMVRYNAKYDMSSKDNVQYVGKLIKRRMSYITNKRSIAKEISINIKKNALHLTSQSHIDVRKFDKIGQSIKDVRQGIWKIYTKPMDDNYDIGQVILYMTHRDYSKTKISKSETLTIDTENIVFNLGVSQTDTVFTLNDTSILDTPLKVTGKSNIFVDAYQKMLTDKMQIQLEYTYDERTKTDRVVSIQIALVNHGYDHTNKAEYDDNGRTCLCHDCILFLKKQYEQRDTYERCV